MVEDIKVYIKDKGSHTDNLFFLLEKRISVYLLFRIQTHYITGFKVEIMRLRFN